MRCVNVRYVLVFMAAGCLLGLVLVPRVTWGADDAPAKGQAVQPAEEKAPPAPAEAAPAKAAKEPLVGRAILEETIAQMVEAARG